MSCLLLRLLVCLVIVVVIVSSFDGPEGVPTYHSVDFACPRYVDLSSIE